ATSEELANADLVVVLPTIDYPSPDGDLTLYDEAWRDEEIGSLLAYVEGGGLLVLTNSANRILLGMVFEANEDKRDVNALSEHFGIVFEESSMSAARARIQEEHPLTESQSGLTLIRGNSVPFTMQSGGTLAEVNGMPVVGLVDYGEAGGQVLVLVDVGILGIAGLGPSESDNLSFVRNLARFARNR
ncbi:MAG: hypothetical protein GTO14_25150, partial [Anaerolineales bacterium]|nr:hypothetical protein [Anaerolineales bacterium]